MIGWLKKHFLKSEPEPKKPYEMSDSELLFAIRLKLMLAKNKDFRRESMSYPVTRYDIKQSMYNLEACLLAVRTRLDIEGAGPHNELLPIAAAMTKVVPADLDKEHLVAKVLFEELGMGKKRKSLDKAGCLLKQGMTLSP